MPLSDLWLNSKKQLEEKNIQQIIAFAGTGHLKDGNDTSSEFRSFLNHVPSDVLIRYTNECLQNSFKDSGLVLQDIINQVGQRLGFEVTNGRYRGVPGDIGFDGLWRFPDGHAVIIEVKTTDAYRIDLSVLAKYRKDLVAANKIVEEKSSILIVVGRKDTGDLEAQIRGSRHAWDMRLISIDSLLRLMELKEEVEDPTIIKRIHDIIIPREFTKLDQIVDILFSTAEEVKQENIEDVDDDNETTDTPKFTPVSFHKACVTKVQEYLKQTLLKRSRSKFSSPDGMNAIVCAISKEHFRSGIKYYWFAFHTHQREFLENSQKSYVALGCGSEDNLFLIPLSDFSPWLEGMNITEKEHSYYWHIKIMEDDKKIILNRKKGWDKIDITSYRIQ